MANKLTLREWNDQSRYTHSPWKVDPKANGLDGEHLVLTMEKKSRFLQILRIVPLIHWNPDDRFELTAGTYSGVDSEGLLIGVQVLFRKRFPTMTEAVDYGVANGLSCLLAFIGTNTTSPIVGPCICGCNQSSVTQEGGVAVRRCDHCGELVSGMRSKLV